MIIGRAKGDQDHPKKINKKRPPQWIGFTACVVRTPENEDNTQSADQEERDVGYDVAEIPASEPPRIGGERKLRVFNWGGAYYTQFWVEFFKPKKSSRFKTARLNPD